MSKCYIKCNAEFIKREFIFFWKKVCILTSKYVSSKYVFCLFSSLQFAELSRAVKARCWPDFSDILTLTVCELHLLCICSQFSGCLTPEIFMAVASLLRVHSDEADFIVGWSEHFISLQHHFFQQRSNQLWSSRIIPY